MGCCLLEMTDFSEKAFESQRKRKKKFVKPGILENMNFLKEQRRDSQFQSLRDVPALAWVAHRLQSLSQHVFVSCGVGSVLV